MARLDKTGQQGAAVEELWERGKDREIGIVIDTALMKLRGLCGEDEVRGTGERSVFTQFFHVFVLPYIETVHARCSSV